MTALMQKQNEHILVSAYSLFVEKGIDAVTIEDIAKESKLGEATIYRHFGKKEKIVTLVAIELWNNLYDKYFKPANTFETGLDGIKFFYSIFIEILKNDRNTIQFITEFDDYIIDKGLKFTSLIEYNAVILKVKKEFDGAFDKGVKDKTIKSNIDRDTFYFTTTHSLLTLLEKLIKEPLVESDKYVSPKSQINMFIDMAINYIKN